MKWNDEKFFLNLTNISKERGIKLTMAHKIFFIKLVNYSMKDGWEYTDRFSITNTIEEMTVMFGMSKGGVLKALKMLEKIRLIERVPVEYGRPIHGMKTNIYKSVIKELEYLL